MAREAGIQQRLAANLAMENSNGNAPYSLPRDAPVRTSGNHIGDALFTPLRRPFHFLDFLEGALTQLPVVNVDEPLIAGAENDGIVATPAMRIRVRKPASRADQSASLSEQLDDGCIRIENPLAFVLR